jgi:iron complex outermembrane receptor protein
MEKDPRADRPNTTIPGATQQNAGIYAQTWYAGLTNRYAAGKDWYNSTSVLVSGTHFDNPFLTDYEQRRELTLDALTRWLYRVENWRVIFGAEYQYTRSFIHDWGNDHGNPDTTQSNNRLQAFQFNPYAQVNWNPAPALLLQAGLSANTFQYHYLPLYGPNTALGVQDIDFHLQVMPRLSLQYTLGEGFVYGTLSRGYSPPTIAQIFPGTALLYNQLQPEQGWNTEVGVKRYFLETRLQGGLSLYDFRMQQSIVPRYDSAGHAYYVNAGGTDQKGLEASVNALLIGWESENGRSVRLSQWVQYLRVFASYALQDYHFRDYMEGAQSYSGNPLTGVPRNVLVGGVDVRVRWGLYLDATGTYTSSIPLNDADTAHAAAYSLVQVKVGWTYPLGWNRRSPELNVYVGVDNLLNQVYSLGDDLNAAGGRYYNPSPARNWFAGVAVKL